MINKVCVVTFLSVLVLATLAQAQSFTVLYNFTGQSDGATPWAGLIQDAAGDLDGTSQGAFVGAGNVYRMDTTGTETVLYTFTGSPDGAGPQAALTIDKAGNLYGTTVAGGGSGPLCGSCGTVFKIDTAGNERVLYTFKGFSDGCLPTQGVIVDEAGDLFGTATQCGSSNLGTIFKLDTAGNFTLLHTFTGGSSDGAYPRWGHLTMDEAGNLYGLAQIGGSTGCTLGKGCGVLYKLSKNGKFALLYSFQGGLSDGCGPGGSLVQDKAGNSYGTTEGCGAGGTGTIWKLSKKGEETVLHNFALSASNGCYPYAGVARDSKGNLYGVTYYCGAYSYGALYELSAKGVFTLLHSFDDYDGANPVGEVLRTAGGTLFGTATTGGTLGGDLSFFGTVWEYLP